MSICAVMCNVQHDSWHSDVVCAFCKTVLLMTLALTSSMLDFSAAVVASACTPVQQLLSMIAA